jgi:putative transposase
MNCFLKINGRIHYSWRAVDATFWTSWSKEKDKKVAKKFLRKLLKQLRYVPCVIITDKLRSYCAVRAELMTSVEHLQQKYQTIGPRILISQPGCESVS